VLRVSSVSAAIVFAISSSALAQGAPERQAASPRDQMQARYNIFVMEGVLERAVEHGAQSLSRQLRPVMPDMFLLSGAAQARGLRLEGYGVFFDVEVPALRPSVAWTLRTMTDENGMAATAALQQLRAFVEEKTPQGPQKVNLLQAIKRLELQVGPAQMPAGQSAGPAPDASVTAATVDSRRTSAPTAPKTSPTDRSWLDDPNEAYTNEVKTALIDAMLDHSGPIGVGTDEWLTVAARDNEHHDRLVQSDLYDTSTIVLRVKGSDLAAYRAERITKDEARKRVEIREF
jgi:hypothetical protein